MVKTGKRYRKVGDLDDERLNANTDFGGEDEELDEPREYRSARPDEEDEDIEEEEDEIDEDVRDLFAEAQQLDYGRGNLISKLRAYTDRTPKLTGGDLDASWEYADVGEEAVGGENPTPDQSVVDDMGEALGLTYEDDEELGAEDKLEQRDKEPWELNPESSEEFEGRIEAEFKRTRRVKPPTDAARQRVTAAHRTAAGKERRPGPRAKTAARANVRVTAPSRKDRTSARRTRGVPGKTRGSRRAA